MSTVTKRPAGLSIIEERPRTNISLDLHEQVRPSFDSFQCTGITIVFGQHFRLSLKEGHERGQFYSLLSAHFNYAFQ